MEPDATVVVLYGLGAAGPGAIFEAAADRWRLVFGYDPRDGHSSEMAPILRSLAPTLEIDADEPAVDVEGARGVVTFSEPLVAAAGRLAASLGCLTNPPETLVALTDKRRQRPALAAAGVDDTRSVAVDRCDPAAAFRAVGGRAVVKPAIGAGSRATRPVESVDELVGVLRTSPEPMVLEERLEGAPHPGSSWLGDYVSVETLSSSGVHHPFCVTDKLPLDERFRETGFVLPSTLAGDARAEVLDLATGALSALGVRHGVTHTEIKLTPKGPRIIEVNGRLGGFLQKPLTRASDLDPVRLALAAAVGEPVAPRPASFDGFVGNVFVLPPLWARRLVRSARKEELAALPGVWAVEQNVPDGAALDPETGTLSRIQTIDLEAATLDELARVVALVRETADGAAVYA
jgi:biotin carboxylase